MVAFMVVAWCATRARRAPRLVGWRRRSAPPAWRSIHKAAAAFFVVRPRRRDALLTSRSRSALDARRLRRDPTARPRPPPRSPRPLDPRPAWPSPARVLALFVLPNWADYRFYNWQMSVTRKPSYDLRSLVDRVTWFPVVARHLHADVVHCSSPSAALSAWLPRWRHGDAPPSGCSALGRARVCRAGPPRRGQRAPVRLLHPGAHRPGGDRPRPRRAACCPSSGLRLSRRDAALAAARWCCTPPTSCCGALARLAFLYEIGPRRAARRRWRGRAACRRCLRRAGRAARAVALEPSGRRPTAAVASSGVVLMAGDLAQFGQWASRAHLQERRGLARARPNGCRRARSCTASSPTGSRSRTGIRPIFVGRGFGNYDDRLRARRCAVYFDLRSPRTSATKDRSSKTCSTAYPNRAIIRTFDVAETATGHDRAALIDKLALRRGRAATPPSRIRESCAGLTSAPSRRTPICGSGPSTTTRCSSTTGARR